MKEKGREAYILFLDELNFAFQFISQRDLTLARKKMEETYILFRQTQLYVYFNLYSRHTLPLFIPAGNTNWKGACYQTHEHLND